MFLHGLIASEAKHIFPLETDDYQVKDERNLGGKQLLA
jgi:hypothetical protein